MSSDWVLNFSLILVGITLLSIPIIMHLIFYKKKKIEECVFFSFWFFAMLINTYNVMYDTYTPSHQGFVWGSFFLGVAKMFILERISKGKPIKWMKTYLSPLLLSLMIIVFILTTKSNDTYTVQLILGMAASYPIGNLLFQLVLNIRKKKLLEIYGEDNFNQFRSLA